MYPHGAPPYPEGPPPESVVREFHGTDIENQTIQVVTERRSELTFVHVYHAWGSGAITDMLFTEDEARFLRDVLVTLYPLRATGLQERRRR